MQNVPLKTSQSRREEDTVFHLVLKLFSIRVIKLCIRVIKIRGKYYGISEEEDIRREEQGGILEVDTTDCLEKWETSGHGQKVKAYFPINCSAHLN